MKKIIALLLACMMVLGLVACGESAAEPTTAPAANNDAPATEASNEEVEVQNITLKVWGPSEDQVPQEGQTVSFLEAACEAFDEAHPEWEIEFTYEVCAEGDAGTMVTKDPSAAADVYAFANDQLGALMQANAIARLGGEALAQVQADNSETMIASVTSGDGVYGVPFTGNTWFMYYDKSVYSEEDIKSLDAMMAIKPVAFPLTNTWNLPAFYYAVGGTMFGDGTDGTAGVQFGGEAGASATLYLANAISAGTLVDDANGAGKDGLKNGLVGAMFSGTWDAEEIQKILGDNYAAAQLPTITVNGTECQMRAFSGSKAYAANPNSANIKAATALAAWLGSAEMQELHFDLRNGSVIPCAVSLLSNEKFSTNPAAVAQNDTIANTSVLQPSIPEMSNYWANAGSMGSALANGEINADNAAEMTEKWNEGLNNSGL